MSSENVSNDFEPNRAFSLLFKDPEWMFKTGIGGMLVAGAIIASLYNFICLPLVAALMALVNGYCFRTMRAAKPSLKSNKVCLPDWNDWGDLFLSGITWMAIQFCLWSLILFLSFFIMAVLTGQAYGASSSTIRVVFITIETIFSALLIALFACLSAFTKVNFALAENSKAGWNYFSTFKKLCSMPRRFLFGFVLAIGIEWASIIIPIITLIGTFLLPSAFFIGQLLSSIVLVQTWVLPEE